MGAAALEFRILGPLDVVVRGRAIELQGRKQLELLASLLIRANEVVPQDVLVDQLWSGKPPPTAAHTLHSHVARLRKRLAEDAPEETAGALETVGPGYLLRVREDELDASRFESLVDDGRRARERGEPEIAADTLRRALALWRGPALADVAYASFAQAEIARLEELRLTALEERVDADLASGRHSEIVGELELLVLEHPLRERMRAQLMLALYRSDRQADALEAYRAARATLVESLGIEPGSALRELERAILEHDPALEPPARPRLSTTSPSPRALRLPSTSFVGRSRDLREIQARLVEPDVRLLTLAGPGGTGKTRLAIEAAARLREEFADGVVLVELAPIADHALVASTIADALELGGLRGTSPVDALVGFLRTRETLLVVDNFEHVLGAVPIVSTLLTGAPGLTVLATSRAPLRLLEERIHVVPALELPDLSHTEVPRLRRTEAVRLFVDRARDVRPEFELTESNAQAVAELCVRLDGLPLALELAAARVRLLSPEEILERLRSRLEPLRASPGAGLPERHQTLRAAIEWSCDLLEAPERELFTNLGVFAGGFTLKGAEAVVLQPELVDAVDSLLEDNLLKVERAAGGNPRFGMLETVREYALERLEERGDPGVVRQRHATFYLALAEAAEPGLLGPQQLDWLERLDAERDNVRAALSWAFVTGETDVGLRIAGSLWRYWQFRSSDREGREWLEQLLAGRTGSEGVRAQAQARTASLAFVHGDFEAVRRYIEASLPILRRIGYEREVITYVGMLAICAHVLGDTERALALADEALDLARRTGDPVAKSYGLNNVGVILAAEGRFDEASEALQKSVELAREVGNVRSVANWSRSVGGVALAHGDAQRARPLLDESLALHRQLGDRWGISHALSSLALLAQEEGDHRSARRFLGESLAIEREVDDRLGLVTNFALAARLAAAEGRREVATRLHAFADALHERAQPWTNRRAMRYAQGHPTELTHSAVSTTMAPGWPPDPAQQIAEVRSALGEEAFSEAWEAGQALTLDEAIALALEEGPQASSAE